MSDKFRILHFSDIHLTEDYDQEVVITAFLRDVEKLEDINIVVCSGDIASKGQFTDVVAGRAKKVLFDPLQSKFKNVPIILCPGNHDVNLKQIKKIIQPAINGVKSPKSANELVVQLDEEILWKHLSRFNSFSDEIGLVPKISNPVFRTFEIDWNGKVIGIAALNSTWRTLGGGPSDYGSLFMGEHQIQKALESLKDAYIKIAVFHHPMEWLHISEQPLVRRTIMQNFDAVLFGHNHDSNSIGVVSPNSATLFAQSGCLYQSRDYFNGYLIIEYGASGKEWNVFAREYYPERNEFDSAPRFSASGQFHFKHSPLEEVIEISAEAVAEIQDSFDKHLLSYNASDVAPKSVGAIFVEPHLSYTSERQEAEKLSETIGTERRKVPRKEYDLDISSIAKTGEDVVFIGRSQSGKTTLLHYISLYRWHEFSETAQFGCFVSAKRLSEGKSTIQHLLELVISSFHGNMLRAQVIRLLESGKIVICIDDIDINHSKSMASINDFRHKYRGCRYIFSQLEDDFDGIAFKQKNDVISGVKRVFMHSFKRKHTRFLVERWFEGSSDIEIKRITKKIDELLRLLNVPRTPFIISTLLWIEENRPTVSLINQAAAIDSLLDGLLNKLQESKSRSHLDSEFKRHFLREYSYYLNNSDKTVIPISEFEEFALSFFKNRGLNHSIRDLIAELTDKGVLFECGFEIGFKFDCFRAFFLAEKMNSDSKLLERAIGFEDIGKYFNEIDLLTGMHRDRIDILEKLYSNVELLSNKLVSPTKIDSFSNIKMSTSFFSKRSFQRIEKKVLDNPNIETDVENELDEIGGLPDLASYDPISSRSREDYSSTSDFHVFILQLRALSITLRNSELVENVDLKERAYNLVILSWERLCILWLDRFERDNFQDIATNNENIRNKPKDEVERIRMFTMLLIPTILLSVISEYLSTPKLERFITDSIKKSQDNSFEKLVSMVLAMDIDKCNWIAELDGLFRVLPVTSFSGNLLFFRSLFHYTHNSSYKMSSSNKNKLKDIIASRIAFTQSKNNNTAKQLVPLYSKEIDKIAMAEE